MFPILRDCTKCLVLRIFVIGTAYVKINLFWDESVWFTSIAVGFGVFLALCHLFYDNPSVRCFPNHLFEHTQSSELLFSDLVKNLTTDASNTHNVQYTTNLSKEVALFMNIECDWKLRIKLQKKYINHVHIFWAFLLHIADDGTGRSQSHQNMEHF
jgi:hypothetical protein